MVQSLKKEEGTLIVDIKAAAAAGNDATTKILAQQLVRLRGNMQRIAVTRASLQSVGSSLTVRPPADGHRSILNCACTPATLPRCASLPAPRLALRCAVTLPPPRLPSPQAAATSSTMASSMQSASKAMTAVGARVPPQQAQEQAKQFARAAAASAAAAAAFDDGVDLALGSDEEEGQAAELVAKLMDEVGLELAAALGPPPDRAVAAPLPAVPTRPPGQAEAEDDELMRMIAEMR
jgi:charged multivesicular body protein 2A/charged multivesicular body protein 2B